MFPFKYAAEEGNESWNITTMDRLRVQLFTNYDKTAHPMVTPTQRTNITLGMTINYIDIDELKGKMTLHGWINMVRIFVDSQWRIFGGYVLIEVFFRSDGETVYAHGIRNILRILPHYMCVPKRYGNRTFLCSIALAVMAII